MSPQPVSQRLRVFVASPGDVAEERETVSYVVPEINRILARVSGLELEVVKWETHSWPDVGVDAQDVINREIGEYDLFVGVMWKRFGTPTKRAASGTGEEFERAFRYYERFRRPRIMFYFRTDPFYSSEPKEISQFQKVIRFRKKLERLGVFFWTYNGVLQFERNLREHLIRQAFDLSSPDTPKPETAAKPPAEGRKPREAPRFPESDVPSPRKVFIAYSHVDRPKARSIYLLLKERGLSPWLDEEDLLPGQEWQGEVQTAMRKAEIILILFSSQAVSAVGFLQKEIQVALDRRQVALETSLVVVRLDRAPLAWDLEGFPTVDYFLAAGPDRLLSELAERSAGQHRLRPEIGKVHSVDPKTRFGFIKPEAGERLFFAESDVGKGLTFDEIQPGDAVMFEVNWREANYRGGRARNIRRRGTAE